MGFEIDFPDWEDIKNLNQDEEYTCTLFEIVSSIYGRITIFEDEQMGFYFDLIYNNYRLYFSSPYIHFHAFYAFNEEEYNQLKMDISNFYNFIIHTITHTGSSIHNFNSEIII